MFIKLFEVRDRATFIPAMAVLLRNRTPEEFFLLRRAGFGSYEIGGDWPLHNAVPYVLLVHLGTSRAHHDSYDWGNRTMSVAHAHIINHWDELESGDVLDVEFILGETPTKKHSEEEVP